MDPFRVESVDIYSNLLYVQERRVELANLAARVVQVNKYSVETCCVVGEWWVKVVVCGGWGKGVRRVYGGEEVEG